jgi:hypothetical protein
MTTDLTIERIWEARRKIYAQCDNDPQKLVAYYIQRQQENPERLLKELNEDVASRQRNVEKLLTPAT